MFQEGSNNNLVPSSPAADQVHSNSQPTTAVASQCSTQSEFTSQQHMVDPCACKPHVHNTSSCSTDARVVAPSSSLAHLGDMKNLLNDESYRASLNPSQTQLLHRWIEKFDSACSHHMSGDHTRIRPNNSQEPPSIRINGFNNSKSFVTLSGMNHYNQAEHYIEDMPENLCLLCAHSFAKEGAAILLESGGYVIRIRPDQMESFMDYIQQFPQVLKLRVSNHTYEVDHESFSANTNISDTAKHPSVPEFDDIFFEALAAATTYFNTKLNTSSVEERILAYLISGITLENLKNYVKYNTATGIHPSVQLAQLNKSENEFGRSPEDVQRCALEARVVKHRHHEVRLSQTALVSRNGQHL